MRVDGMGREGMGRGRLEVRVWYGMVWSGYGMVWWYGYVVCAEWHEWRKIRGTRSLARCGVLVSVARLAAVRSALVFC